jgi:hypothetical protein
MGGAVVTRACPALLEKKFRITGAVVLDVVEGWVKHARMIIRLILRYRFCARSAAAYAYAT